MKRMRKSIIWMAAFMFCCGAVFAQKAERKNVREGNKLYETEKFTEAEIAYRKSLEVNPRSSEGTYNLGNALYKQKKFPEAAEQYQLLAGQGEKMIETPEGKARLAEIYHNVGNIGMQSKEYAKSVEAYKQSLRLNPKDDETRYNLALAQKLLHDQQNQQNEDQNQDQNEDKKEDQDKQDQQQQNQDQQQQQDDKKQDKTQEQQPQQQEQMSKDNAQQMLDAFLQDEKDTQEKVKKAQAQQQQRRRTDKEWKLVFLFVLFATFGVVARAADVTFKASAPEAVVMGETFRLSYTVNAEGRDIRVPEIPDFEVLIGPSTSTNMSTQIINGKMTTETSLTFTYILQPKKEGTFNIAPATIKVKGANYTSNALVIKVLPPDKAEEATKGGSTGTGISKDDAFLTIDVSKRNVYEQEGILVTFKLYVRKDIGGIDQPKFPEFTGFLAQEVELPQNKQLVMENYKGKNYGTAIIKQTVLYPQRSGKITIPSGKLDIVLRVPGPARQRSSVFDDFFGSSS